jgi:hypothetical protein
MSRPIADRFIRLALARTLRGIDRRTAQEITIGSRKMPGSHDPGIANRG